MVLRSSKGARTLEAEKFFTGPMSTAVRPDECVEEIHWPVGSEKRTGSAFTEIAIRHGDFAMVARGGAGGVRRECRCTRARPWAWAARGGTPLAFPKIVARLVGTKLDDKAIDDVASDASKETDPGADLHASKEYRRHLARVLAGRVLREARDGAGLR